MELEAWPIIKWVLIVLLAGFIGHFGKVLAQSVMAKIRAKKTGASSPPRQSLPVDQMDQLDQIDQDTKPLPEAPAYNKTGEDQTIPSSRKNDRTADKKMLKAIAKQTKKALKKK
jgi:hypothetical protein